MLELFTSFWNNPLLPEVDAVMVSTSRGDPRRRLPFKFRKSWSLAPSRETFEAADDWDRFTRLYRNQLDELGVDHIVGELRRVSEEAGGLPLVLLCHERDPADCHRGLFADWYEQHTGNPVPELQPGMISPKSGVSYQTRLL
ncbi:MAG: DUF488 domain-containing protein [Rubrobacter sp.]|nr:DUF488 domain-containing protein [Rubrobacter sp.]